MPELTTSEQAEIASQRLDLRRAVRAYRDRFFDELTPEQRSQIRDFWTLLGDDVDHLVAVAIRMSLAELQESMASLGKVTDGLKNAVDHLNEVRKVITIATSLVDLGAAIATASPTGVA